MNEVLAHYAYGPAPSLVLKDVRVVSRATDVDGLGVDYMELELDLGARALHVAIFSPAGLAEVPAVLGPNQCGNDKLVLDERVRQMTAFLGAKCEEEARGDDANNWPLARIAASGFAVVTFPQSEMCPDDVDACEGEALAAWAKGSSLAMDALEAVSTPVDPTRVAVFGHSRRGKAALLAGARDERIAAVVAHQSGTLGSSILRNDLGESLLLVTGVFPHWFNTELLGFAGYEDRLPFDQHWLVALSAPRPVLLIDGAEDDWADPAGSLEAARAADPAWELLGEEGLVEDSGVPRTDATLVHQIRPGGHDLLTEDWDLVLPFLEAHVR